jgi:hypothetical protein
MKIRDVFNYENIFTATFIVGLISAAVFQASTWDDVDQMVEKQQAERQRISAIPDSVRDFATAHGYANDLVYVRNNLGLCIAVDTGNPNLMQPPSGFHVPCTEEVLEIISQNEAEASRHAPVPGLR